MINNVISTSQIKIVDSIEGEQHFQCLTPRYCQNYEEIGLLVGISGVFHSLYIIRLTS
jgi:hypothetical protein